MPHMMWQAARYPSWMCAVSVLGMMTATSAMSFSFPPGPVKDSVLQPSSLALSRARMTFFELPEVDMPMTASPGLAKASTCLLNTMS